MIKNFKTRRLIPQQRGAPKLLREENPLPLLKILNPNIPSHSIAGLGTSRATLEESPPGQSLENHFPFHPEVSPLSTLATIQDSGNSETIKLALLHQLFRHCGDPAIRLLQRNEATSLCQQISSTREGPLLPQVAGFINIPIEHLQKELMRLLRQPILRLDPFLAHLRNERLGMYSALLSPHGILPILCFDRLLTVLAEIPLVDPLVIRLCQEHALPVQWCHVVTIKFKGLASFLTFSPE